MYSPYGAEHCAVSSGFAMRAMHDLPPPRRLVVRPGSGGGVRSLPARSLPGLFGRCLSNVVRAHIKNTTTFQNVYSSILKLLNLICVDLFAAQQTSRHLWGLNCVPERNTSIPEILNAHRIAVVIAKLLNVDRRVTVHARPLRRTLII